MIRLRWLQPGIGIKRWLLLSLVGILVSGLATAALVGVKLEDGHSTLHRFVATLTPWAAVLLWVAGVAVTATAIVTLHRVLLQGLHVPRETAGYARAYLRNRLLERGPRVVTLGGGTGLSTILTGLKDHSSNLTAVVTVADDGGSSGRIRNELGVLPPGDIRNCLVALARRGPLLKELLQHRFSKGEGLTGHSFGNLLLAALNEITGSFIEAVRATSEVLAIAGEVLPSTCQNVILGVRLADGREIRGESLIPKARGRIASVFLEPQPVFPPHEVLDRLGTADLIVLGPGSLFTSIVPNLLVQGVADAVNRARSPVIYIANMMTQPGETDGFSVGDHVRALLTMTPLTRLDAVLVNSRPIDSTRLMNYEREGATRAVLEPDLPERLGVQVIAADLLSLEGLVRHDPQKTAAVLMAALGAQAE